MKVPPYLDILNPEQQEAVLHDGLSGDPDRFAGSWPADIARRPLLILAGAGSGKTRVITTKIAYLIRDRGVDPRSIMAVTFTNKAAREMADRARLIDSRAAGAMMRTFHSFGAWFLRRHADLAGLNSDFVIYDDDDMTALLRTIMENASKAELRDTAAQISRAKDYFLSPEDPELHRINYQDRFRKNYARYEEKLNKIGNVDFGDLIKKPLEILQNNPDLARRFHERFRVIMVDEYQDSNVAQFKLLSCMTGPGTYLCVVGDDDQSIYRFRGADVTNILRFSDHFPGTDIIRLERNYRSFAPILALASSVVDHNRGRLGKTLRAERGDGKIPALAFLSNQDEEAAFCAELVERSVKAGGSEKARRVKRAGKLEKAEDTGKVEDTGITGKTEKARRAPQYSDWAILYRTNAQSLGFETELLRRGIPYKVVGSLKFYQREEVKDALALLALLLNPRDEVAFRRIINKPPRGIGAAALDKIFQNAYMSALSDGGLLDMAKKIPLSPRAGAGIEGFAALMDRAAAVLDGAPPPVRPDSPIRYGEGLSPCVASLIIDSTLVEYHGSHDEINGLQRIGNLQELVNASTLYGGTREGLVEFMEHIELDRSVEGDEKNLNSVTLITLHNTKGLEFPRVIITGLEQGIFPRADKDGDELEEERRLFYVGATRAMEELYLCSCGARRMYGHTSPMSPSLFLYEADQTVLRVIGKIPAGFVRSRSRRPGASGGSGGFNGEPAAPVKTSSDGRWNRGDRVFHDDQGYGTVIDLGEGEDGPVITVRFENGQERRFLSLHQSGSYIKIGREDF
ncbi:MAG: ATP-dependent helicase [Spirochaetaceae bacterium]|jgi:DNA helicase-2/ATP-dependent DNA helicase PcrA|nr:ATP-dependent helicase [Spirochaetaceae bacterium]